jgi:hypothetical protein
MSRHYAITSLRQGRKIAGGVGGSFGDGSAAAGSRGQVYVPVVMPTIPDGGFWASAPHGVA